MRANGYWQTWDTRDSTIIIFRIKSVKKMKRKDDRLSLRDRIEWLAITKINPDEKVNLILDINGALR